VALLLFALGLELSLDRIRTMRSLIFGLGSQQMLICAALIGGILYALGLPPVAVAALAGALALSSTAVGLQLLSASGRLNSQAGRKALGVLLFQDLAIAPMLLLIGAGSGGNFGRSLAIGVVTLLGIALFARHVVPPLFLQAARTRRAELFLAAAMVVLIASAAAAALAGLSPAVGALTAGLMLSTSDYRRQIEAAILPLEGLLLGVFLIWVGSGLDLAAIAANPWPVLGGAAAVIAIKGGAIYGLLRLRRARKGVAGHVALLLASPSETSLIVLGAAVTAGLVGGTTAPMRWRWPRSPWRWHRCWAWPAPGWKRKPARNATTPRPPARRRARPSSSAMAGWAGWWRRCWTCMINRGWPSMPILMRCSA
jgi:monovalent cation:H+ antiporter-2, CPA2 family